MADEFAEIEQTYRNVGTIRLISDLFGGTPVEMRSLWSSALSWRLVVFGLNDDTW